MKACLSARGGVIVTATLLSTGSVLPEGLAKQSWGATITTRVRDDMRIYGRPTSEHTSGSTDGVRNVFLSYFARQSARR